MVIKIADFGLARDILRYVKTGINVLHLQLTTTDINKLLRLRNLHNFMISEQKSNEDIKKTSQQYENSCKCVK